MLLNQMISFVSRNIVGGNSKCTNGKASRLSANQGSSSSGTPWYSASACNWYSNSGDSDYSADAAKCVGIVIGSDNTPPRKLIIK